MVSEVGIAVQLHNRYIAQHYWYRRRLRYITAKPFFLVLERLFNMDLVLHVYPMRTNAACSGDVNKKTGKD